MTILFRPQGAFGWFSYTTSWDTIEGSGAVDDLVDELKASVLAKKRATVERNREKIEKPTWYEEAIALKEHGLVTSVIARRLEKSPSQVRRVLNKAKK